MKTKLNSKFKTLKFNGKASEYFKIWIVNIFLTIITLGIYSAWAKVRNYRYFYSNTVLQNSYFEYGADPIRILIGRVIVIAIYGAFAMSDMLFNQYVAIGISLLFLLLIPWLVYNAIRFKLRYSIFRNINFSYRNKISNVYKFFIGHILLYVISFALFFPYSYSRFKNLIISNSYYGNKKFNYTGSAWQFYKIFFATAVISFVLILIMAASSVTIFGFFDDGYFTEFSYDIYMSTGSVILAKISTPIFTFLLFMPFLLVWFFVYAFFQASVTNYVWVETKLEDLKFNSTLKSFRLGWIYATNFLITLLSLGLAMPWATIRLLKYKLENIWVYDRDIDEYVSLMEADLNAIGEETQDFFDIDVGV